MDFLTKDNSLAFSDVNVKEGIVSGYFASFDDVPDSDGDIIVPGAFAKTIKENGPQGKGRIRHLLDHNWEKGVAVIQELKEDHKGLFYVSKIGRHTLGKDFILMIEDGIVKEHSFGYRVIKHQKSENGHNLLTEIQKYEGSSLQGWGANGNTPFTSLKSMEDILDQYDRLYKALKHGTYSDEMMLKFQEQHTLLSEYFKTTQPPISTVPSEGKEEKTAKEFNSEAFIQHFKTALGNGRGANERSC